jgi:phage tail protein X
MANYQDIYTTVTGDMWDLISFKVYGSEKYTPDLLRANPELRDIAVFAGGVEIMCPDIDVERADPLPPWKQ